MPGCAGLSLGASGSFLACDLSASPSPQTQSCLDTDVSPHSIHGKSVNNDSWTLVTRMGHSGICILKMFSHFHAQKAMNHGLQLLFVLRHCKQIRFAFGRRI